MKINELLNESVFDRIAHYHPNYDSNKIDREINPEINYYSQEEKKNSKKILNQDGSINIVTTAPEDKEKWTNKPENGNISPGARGLKKFARRNV
jgi:hypothetical protein